MAPQVIIRRSNANGGCGTAVALTKRVDEQDERIVVPIKVYPRREFNRQPPTADDELRYSKTEVAALRLEIRAMRDKIYRMETMLQDELKMWKHGLQDGEWETHEAVKRRLNRLQGAIDCIGRADSAVINTSAHLTER